MQARAHTILPPPEGFENYVPRSHGKGDSKVPKASHKPADPQGGGGSGPNGGKGEGAGC